MATIEEITIIGLLAILLIFALRNHLMMNAMGQMTFGTMGEVLAFVEDVRDRLQLEAEQMKQEGVDNTGEWRDWDSN